MAKTTDVSESGEPLGRLVCSVPQNLIVEVQDALNHFRRETGRKASTSAFVEVAVRELLAKHDLNAVLRRYNASAKRLVVGE